MIREVMTVLFANVSPQKALYKNVYLFAPWYSKKCRHNDLVGISVRFRTSC